MGGTRAIPTAALIRLAEDLGVELRTGAHVAEIVVERNAVQGVRLQSGERLHVSAVVSNSDSVRTHRELLAGKAQQKFMRRRRYEPACSGVVLYLGLRRRYDQLLHHNFVFSRDPHEEFEYIYGAASPPRIRPATSVLRRSPTPRWLRTAAKPCTCSCTRPICGRIIVGKRCCRTIDGRFWKN